MHGPRLRRGRRIILAAGLTLAVTPSASAGLWGQGALALSSSGCSTPPPADWKAALAVLHRTVLRCPQSVPNPSLPAGTDTVPGINHIVVLMMENHTYDNILGMLGKGDGFTLGPGGQPTATNPYPSGSTYPDGYIQHAFHMPTTCQLDSRPSQEWEASHNAYDNGRNDGFVRTPISPADSQIVGGVAMGYWTGQDLPFTYSLASQFPVGDRWFSSALAQTDPERRYLIAGTSSGMTDDIGTSPGNAVPDAGLGLPAPTIFNELDLFKISWTDYVYSYPTGATPNLYPTTTGPTEAVHHKSFDQFFTDAAAGQLPSFSLLDENFATSSQENPQNMVLGDQLMAQVVNALGRSADWSSTLLVITYDEGGGYYDHVPPPVALPPDAIPPQVQPGESSYDGFSRYGFRVPAIVVSPYAKRGFVSNVVHDHTSILAMLERKWNLPALTWRDANANDLTDFIDMRALTRHHPTFPVLPRLAAPAPTHGCPQVAIPPAGSVTPG
jgi:phospholipase C